MFTRFVILLTLLDVKNGGGNEKGHSVWGEIVQIVTHIGPSPLYTFTFIIQCYCIYVKVNNDKHSQVF
jgi:hypothetical protein